MVNSVSQTHCILPLIVHAPLFYTFSMPRWKGSKILILMSKAGSHQDKFHCCISHFPQTSSFHFFCWLDFLHYPIFSRMFFLVECTLKENTLHIFRNEIWLRLEDSCKRNSIFIVQCPACCMLHQWPPLAVKSYLEQKTCLNMQPKWHTKLVLFILTSISETVKQLRKLKLAKNLI